MWRVYNLHHTSVFTYSHANTPLGQSERAYYLSYFIKYINKFKHIAKKTFGFFLLCFKGFRFNKLEIDFLIGGRELGHPSRYQPRPTGLNFGEQTGTGVFPLVIAAPTNMIAVTTQCWIGLWSAE